MQEIILPGTNLDTIVTGNANRNGALITHHDDHVTIEISVIGRKLKGVPGKFAALYRVSWVGTAPPPSEDCIPFDPGQAQVVEVDGQWKVTAADTWLLDFGDNRNNAETALNIIKHYKMNEQCFVGRPLAHMEYYLVNGASPQGAIAGEDCVPFDPSALQVQYIRGRWNVNDGSIVLLDFDQEEDQARQALTYILRYGFRYICYVGRPDAPMTYFRK